MSEHPHVSGFYVVLAAIITGAFGVDGCSLSAEPNGGPIALRGPGQTLNASA